MIWGLINTVAADQQTTPNPNGTAACFFNADAASQSVYLVDSAGLGTGWGLPVGLGTGQSISNGQPAANRPGRR